MGLRRLLRRADDISACFLFFFLSFVALLSVFVFFSLFFFSLVY